MGDKASLKTVGSDAFPTPEEIVARLDRYIISQSEAKKAVAIALRNRWRRQRVEGRIKEEIYPNNIILIGPTGVGKTEIARRLAGLARAPFMKVEASRFTEVGYVGRDVESMVRDLVEISVNMVRQEKTAMMQEKAKQYAEERILDILLPAPVKADTDQTAPDVGKKVSDTREKMRQLLHQGKLDERVVELEVSRQATAPFIEIFSQSGIEDLSVALEEAFGS
jgi:ATP-dependent HslUV protease ATP-binding subunit HslU